jgi:hypothetical protein
MPSPPPALSSPPSASAGVADIRNFLENHHAQKKTFVRLAVVPGTSPSSLPPGAASSCCPSISEESSLHHSEFAPSLASSSSQSASAPSIFSFNSQSSGSVEPDRLEEEQAPRIYPCDFWGYTNCLHRFRLGEDCHWFAHTAVHLGHKFPKTSVCWFCDEVFHLDSEDQAILKMVFRQRMDHIGRHLVAQHYRQEEGQSIRPDFYLLEHLLANGLVPESARAKAETYSEIPLPNGVIRGAPPKRETGNVVTVVGPRGRGSSRKSSSRFAQRSYHR